MSFILDALKKSEIERQRQSVPGLMDARSRERRKRLPVWAVVLAVLLGINLLALVFVLWHRNAAVPHAAPAAAAVTARGCRLHRARGAALQPLGSLAGVRAGNSGAGCRKPGRCFGYGARE